MVIIIIIIIIIIIRHSKWADDSLLQMDILLFKTVGTHRHLSSLT